MSPQTTTNEISNAALSAQTDVLTAEYRRFQKRYQETGICFNMARGKPSPAQLELSAGLLTVLNDIHSLISANGTDCRNYGVVDGLHEAKELMSVFLDDDPQNIIIYGESSLNLMYDTLVRLMLFGTQGHTPWKDAGNISFLCPVPGYDRHFTLCETFGIKMIPVPLTAEGPCMDTVRRLVKEDASVKGIWCVPQYANPSGTTYSDETVRALASMECAAPDFRIFWDNAYSVHHLYDEPSRQDHVLDIGRACREAGNPQRYYKFASTSKVTLPGAGISAFAASPENVAETKAHMNAQTIGHDKINQLRHVRFLKDAEGLRAHMSAHAAILRPKFELVIRKLEEGLSDDWACSWENPRGGYFVSFNAPEGCAKRIVGLAKEAGLIMTGAGATWPYKNDPHDSNIRIAPTFPSIEELDRAMDVFLCCVKIAVCEAADPAFRFDA